MALSTEEKLKLYREMILCVQDLYFWTYDKEFELKDTNCPDADLVNMLFISVSGSVPNDDDRPAIITSELGLSWIVNMERDNEGDPCYFHVVGPTTTTELSMDRLKKEIRRRHGVSLSVMKDAEMLMSKIPMTSMSRMIEYGLMLHYCLTGERLTGYDVIYPETVTPPRKERSKHTENPEGTWLVEQKIYKLVEEGNLNFRNEMGRLVGGTTPADMGSGDIVRHYKNMCIVFVAGCARAAMRGGLPPETAYNISDKYIEDVERCSSVSELTKLNDTIQEDFTVRVHRIKNQDISPQIRQACDFIQIHIEEDLDLETVSSAIGYSVSWLSGKFRREMGKTVGQYIAEQKIERAKLLLKADNRPVQEIAEQLNFKTSSHFGAMFRQHTGMTPSGYRNDISSISELVRS